MYLDIVHIWNTTATSHYLSRGYNLFLLFLHKILLAPLLRYSLLVTYCVKIYEIITREPYYDGGQAGGVLAPMFPDHWEHWVQTQWAGCAWYYYGIIMTLTHYKVNTSSVQQGSQAVKSQVLCS